MGIIRRIFGKKEPALAKNASHDKTAIQANGAMGRLARIEEGPAKYGGYVQLVPKVKELKKKGKNTQAIKILLKAIELTESEDRYIGGNWGVAPWYYEQIAILYRKEKPYTNEIRILERFEKQNKARGEKPKKLADRLVKARELAKKNRN